MPMELKVKFPENYLTIRDIQVSKNIKEIIEANVAAGTPEELLEIKKKLFRANELYFNHQYQKAIEVYKLLQGDIYKMLNPSIPKHIVGLREVQFPIEKNMFEPLLAVSQKYLDAIIPQNVEITSRTAFEEISKSMPKSLKLYLNLGVHVDSDDTTSNKTTIRDIYKLRYNRKTLTEYRVPTELPGVFEAEIPHIYLFMIPVALGDCYNGLAQFEIAEGYYLKAADYEYINPDMEVPALWMKLAQNALEWGDQKYRNEEYQTALEIYRKVVESTGSSLVVPADSTLYTHKELKNVGNDVQAMLEHFDKEGAGNLNPNLAMIVLTIRKRLIQMQAGLDFFGLSTDIIPVWSFEYLQSVARYFAHQAVNAEREFVNFWDRAENETLTGNQLEEAAATANAEWNIATKQLEDVKKEKKIYEDGESLAAKRRKNMEQNKKDYEAMSWARIYLDNEKELIDNEVKKNFPEELDKLYDIVKSMYGKYHLPEYVRSLVDFEDWMNNWTEREKIDYSFEEIRSKYADRMQLITQDYELAAMQRQIDELQIAESVAKKQQEAQYDVAVHNEAIAECHKNYANDNVTAFNEQLFTSEVWFEMGRFMGNISNNYFEIALKAAKMMQRAYNFENDLKRDIIKSNYSGHNVSRTLPTEETFRMLAGDALLLDIDSFTYDQLVTVRRKQIPVKQTISLHQRYPFQFESQFRKTGKIDFETRLEDFDLVFPGTYGRRVENIEVEIQGLIPWSGIKGKLTNNGISRYRTRDISEINLRIQSRETLLLSEYRLKEDSFVFPAESGKLKVFEGVGVEGSWALEIPRENNDLDFNSIIDIRITFYYNAFYDQALEAAVKEKLKEFANANARQKSMTLRWAYPDAFLNFKNTGKLAFSLNTLDFPFNEQNPQIRQMAMLLITEPGTDPSGWSIRLGVPGHPDPVAASTNKDGEIVTSKGHQWTPIAKGAAIGDYIVEIRADDNPGLVENGLLKLDKIRNIIIILEYEYTPRT